MAGRIELVADQRGLRDQSVADLTRQSIERNPSFLFAMDYRYDKTLFYERLADWRTPTKELGRLAKDLGRRFQCCSSVSRKRNARKKTRKDLGLAGARLQRADRRSARRQEQPTAMRH
jgi:hypothetical protein